MSASSPLLKDLLARGLAELGEDPEALPQRLDRLALLAERVAAWTRRVDLSAHETPEAVARRLVLDALALCNAAPPFSTLADLGSGAGFPGLPIAIRHPDRQVTLLESRERRHHFQRSVIRELGIPNATALRGRAESAEGSFDAVVAQAMAEPAQALAWMVAWARPGGTLLLPGGPLPPEVPDHPEVPESSVVFYRVPLGGAQRSLWIGRLRAS